MDNGNFYKLNQDKSSGLSANTLREVIKNLEQIPEYRYFIPMNTVIEVWRSFRKLGYTVKRVKGRNEIRIVDDMNNETTIMVDQFNKLEKGKIVCVPVSMLSPFALRPPIVFERPDFDYMLFLRVRPWGRI